jgi:hypothetical protein
MRVLFIALIERSSIQRWNKDSMGEKERCEGIDADDE